MRDAFVLLCAPAYSVVDASRNILALRQQRTRTTYGHLVSFLGYDVIRSIFECNFSVNIFDVNFSFPRRNRPMELIVHFNEINLCIRISSS